MQQPCTWPLGVRYGLSLSFVVDADGITAHCVRSTNTALVAPLKLHWLPVHVQRLLLYVVLVQSMSLTSISDCTVQAAPDDTMNTVAEHTPMGAWGLEMKMVFACARPPGFMKMLTSWPPSPLHVVLLRSCTPAKQGGKHS